MSDSTVKIGFQDLLSGGYINEIISVVPATAPVESLGGGLVDKDGQPRRAALGKAPGFLDSQGRWQLMRNWADRDVGIDDILKWSETGCNIGLRTRVYPALDIDCDNPMIADFIQECAFDHFGYAPVRVRGNSGRRALLYRALEPGAITKSAVTFESMFGETFKVEMLGAGQQFVVAGSHPSGSDYEWVEGASGGLWESDDLLWVTPESVDDFLGSVLPRALELFEITCEVVKRTRAGVAGSDFEIGDPRLMAPGGDAGLAACGKLLGAVACADLDYDEWVAVTVAYKAATGGSVDAFDVWLEWCEGYEGNLSSDKPAELWNSVRSARVGFDYLVGKAVEAGFDDFGAVAALDFADLDVDEAIVASGGETGPEDVLLEKEIRRTVGTALGQDSIRLRLARLAEADIDSFAGLLDRLLKGDAAAGLGPMRIKTEWTRAISRGQRLLEKERKQAARERQRKEIQRAGKFDEDGKLVVVWDESKCDALIEGILDHLAKVAVDDPVAPLARYAGQWATVMRRRAATILDVMRAHAGGDEGNQEIKILSPEGMASRVEQFVAFLVPGKDGFRAIAMPDLMKRRMFDSALQAQNYPETIGILRSPTITWNGDLIQDAGWHQAQGVYMTLDRGRFDPVPEKVGRDEAVESLEWLREEFLKGFCFERESDRAAALAALLTGITRKTLGSFAPLFSIQAPFQGTGKTTLAQMIGAAAFGVIPGTASEPRTEEEMRKSVLGWLEQSSNMVLLDNIRRGKSFDSESLASAITSPRFEGRRLGTNDIVSYPTSVLWIVTGNNIHMANDMATRSIVCRLLPLDYGEKVLAYVSDDEEGDDSEGFDSFDDLELVSSKDHQQRSDVMSWVLDNRGAIVWHALRLLKGYRCFRDAGGEAVRVASPTRFSEWRSLVAEAIAWAGGGDCTECLLDLEQDDEDISPLGGLLKAWVGVFDARPVPLSEVWEAAFSLEDFDSLGEDPSVLKARGKLKDEILTFCGGTRYTSPLSLSKKLMGFVNTGAQGLTLKKGKKTLKGRLWSVNKGGVRSSRSVDDE